MTRSVEKLDILHYTKLWVANHLFSDYQVENKKIKADSGEFYYPLQNSDMDEVIFDDIHYSETMLY